MDALSRTYEFIALETQPFVLKMASNPKEINK